MIKGSIQEEHIRIINIYAPNIEASQYIRQILIAIKGEIDSTTIVAGDFNTLLTRDVLIRLLLPECYWPEMYQYIFRVRYN